MLKLNLGDQQVYCLLRCSLYHGPNRSIFQSFQSHSSGWPVLSINSSWPSDTLWWQRSGSTLAQVMACCLTAPWVKHRQSRYHYQCHPNHSICILLCTGESVDVEQGLAAASGRPYEDDTKLSKFKDKYLNSQWHKKYWYGDRYWPFYAEFIG